MRVLALISVVAIACAAPSFAQTQAYNRGGGTQAFVNMCLRNAANLSTPEPTCACGAGIISGRMDDR